MKTQNYGLFHLVLRACKQYLQVSKGWALLEHGISILHALSWTGIIIATQRLFDAVTQQPEFRRIAMALGLLVVLSVLQQILAGADNFIFTYVSYGNSGKFMAEFQRKLGRIPAERFEDPNFLNEVEKSRECLEYEALGTFTATCLQLVTYYAVFFISVGWFLFRLSPLLPLVIIVAFIPALLGLFAQARIFADLEEESAPLRRRLESYEDAIADRAYFKETRLLGGFHYFQNLFAQTLLAVTEKTWQTQRKAFVVRLGLSCFSFIGLGVSVLLLSRATMSGAISIGAFAAVFAGLTQIFSLMSEVVTTRFSEASEYVGQIGDYYRLLDLPEITGSTDIPNFTKGVVAENVTFSYPGRENPAVSNINLKIENGETVAIVGENGAGKSTLVRLLTGLYTPSEGKVTVGGLDTKHTNPQTLFSQTSGVFQRYQRYKETLQDNVAISDIRKPIVETEITNALNEANFDLSDIALDTMLAPEFDGIDISGGQWQRLAIARGLYRTHQFIILDEPTAAIDPIEESRIYRQFEQLAADKCALIVTHRLGSAKLADRIIVMANGEIVDSGTHDQLLERPGKYAEMWHEQSKWY